MKTSLRFGLLASSVLAGFSLCLEPASAAQSTADACSAVLMNRSPATIEQFVKEYPVDGEACLATATTSHGFAFGRDHAGQGYSSDRGPDHGNAGNIGHGGGNTGNSGSATGNGGSSGGHVGSGSSNTNAANSGNGGGTTASANSGSSGGSGPGHTSAGNSDNGEIGRASCRDRV
jgi:hypothetical protein